MYKYNDLTGNKFGSLLVVNNVGKTKDRHLLWRCLCDCGNTVDVSSRDLTTGHTKSCGCLQKDKVSKIRYIHGDRDARLYSVWKTMKKRCENPTCKSYQYYGAKGVSVCDEWHNYSIFREWAYQNGYDDSAEKYKCTIDRINPFGNYEPSNCRWVDMKVQNNNKRRQADMRGENKSE